MNKKGFTLIEILVVVVILGIISLVAIPNVVEMSDRNKKSQMINDAQALVNKAKNKYTLANAADKKSEYFLSDLGFSGTDGYGDDYTSGSVRIVLVEMGNKYIYIVKLETSKHCLGSSNTCDGISSDNLDIKYVIER